MDLQGKSIVFFDGECHFCIGWVKFIIDRDGKDRFRFASLQSPWTQGFFSQESFPMPEPAALVLFENGNFHLASEAVSRIAAGLPGIWKMGQHITRIPFPIRNRAYHWIAARRFTLFGKRDQCWVPTPDLRMKFADL